ncbi:MAG TPA: GyrI-like domain-containing protein [Thermoanaerobaculia bacterium]|nr:GyrI-like domain-containing protein [Thermoanaerobaculia bacterium]
MPYQCHLREIKSQPVMSVRGRTTPKALTATISELLREVGRYIQGAGGKVVGPVFTRYHKRTAEEIELEAGVPVDRSLPGDARVQSGELPAGHAVATTHLGPYDGLPAASEALATWAQQNGREPAGPPWEFYLNDPAATDPKEWKTEVVQPLMPQYF